MESLKKLLIYEIYLFFASISWFVSLVSKSYIYYAIIFQFLLLLLIAFLSNWKFNIKLFVFSIFFFFITVFNYLLGAQFEINGVLLSLIFLFQINFNNTYINSLNTLEPIVEIILKTIVRIFVLIFLVDFFYFIFNPHGLPVIIQTITPILLLVFLGTSFLFYKSLKYLIVVFVLSIYFIISSVFSFNNEPIVQEIQVVLLLIIVIYFILLKYFHGRMLSLLYMSFSFGFVSLLLFYSEILSFMYLISPFSFNLRLAINLSMLKDMNFYNLLIGSGLGSSFKQYDVTLFSPEEYQFEFDMMPPHSGLLIILYEYGLIGVLFLLMFVNKALRGVKEKLRKSLLVFSFFVFVMLNSIYVQLIPSGDLYFQSNGILFFMFIKLVSDKRLLSIIDKKYLSLQIIRK